jgi:hypothetical protein
MKLKWIEWPIPTQTPGDRTSTNNVRIIHTNSMLYIILIREYIGLLCF